MEGFHEWLHFGAAFMQYMHSLETPHFENEAEAFTHYFNRFPEELLTPDLFTKNNTLADIAKSKGNDLYKLKDFPNAEREYRIALRLAVSNTKMYAVILANLSAVKFAQHKYEICIKLIELSMQHHVDPKLFIREMRAWMKLGKADRANGTFLKFQRSLGVSQVSKQVKDKFLEEAKKILELPLGEKKYVCDDSSDYLVGELDMNPKFLNVTVKAELKYSKKYGRHVVAKNDIKKGETVLIDYPYASHGTDYCPNCFHPIIIPYPCEECSMLVYCCNSCRAIDVYIHKWECKMCRMDIMYNSELFTELTKMTFRMFLKGLLSGNEMKISGSHDVSSSFGSAADNFRYVQSLFMDFKTFSKNEQFVHCVKECCFLMKYIIHHHESLLLKIRKTNVFGNVLGKKNLITATGKYLLQLHIISYYNKYTYISQSKSINFFLFPSYSLFNNACTPNTSKLMDGPHLVLVAAEDISKGEQIFTAYIISNLLINIAKRKQYLKTMYDFDCKCKACTPSLEEKLIKCPQCCGPYCLPNISNKFVCEQCRYQFPYSTMMRIEHFILSAKHFDETRDIKYLRECVKVVEELQLNYECTPVKFCILLLITEEIKLDFIAQREMEGFLSSSETRDFENEAEAFIYYFNKFPDMILRELLTPKLFTKSNTLADIVKNKGNDLYKLKDFPNAEREYRIALRLAVSNTKMYATCIKLIALSMQHHVDPKLFTREMRAWMKLGKADQASGAFLKFQKSLGVSRVSKEVKGKFLEEAKKILDLPIGEKKYVCDDSSDYLVGELDMNPRFLNVTVKAELKYNKKYGRHVVAKNDIKKGETVLIDYPYASQGTDYCPNCFQPIIIPYPCEECSMLVYCCERCRVIDVNIHKWECKMCRMDIMDNPELLTNMTKMTFRMFLKGLLSCNEMKISGSHDVSSSFGSAADNFRYVQSLFMDFKTFSKNEQFVHCVKECCFLMKYIIHHHESLLLKIRETNVFGNVPGKKNLITATGKYLVQLHIISYYNKYTYISESKSINFFLFPSYSLFNNACIPNTSKLMDGPHLVLLAAEDISKGEQICTAYIKSNLFTNTAKRKQHLKTMYNFDCKCKACMPSFKEKLIKCPQCCGPYCLPNISNKFVCEQCRYQFSYSTMMRILNLFLSADQFDVTRDINCLRESAKVVEELSLNYEYIPIKVFILQLIAEEIKLGNLEIGVKYFLKVKKIQNDVISFHYGEVYRAIEGYTRQLYISDKPYEKRFKKTTLEELLLLLDVFQEHLQILIPLKSVLKGIGDLKEFYKIHLSILKLDESVTWANDD